MRKYSASTKRVKSRLKTLRGKGKSSMYMETERFNQHVLRKLIPRARVATSDALMVIALEVDRRIMLAWPVDTGRSRAAWSALMEEEGMPVPSAQGNKVSAEAEAEGKMLGEVKKDLTGTKQSISLINGIEYSPALEVGWSKQAPRGVVRRVLMGVRKGVTREAFEKELKDVK